MSATQRTICVSILARDGSVSGVTTTTGASLFEAAANAIRFFDDPYWRGEKPRPETILEVSAVVLDQRWRVRVGRIIQWRRDMSKAAAV